MSKISYQYQPHYQPHPTYMHPHSQQHQDAHMLKRETLQVVEPWVQNGLREAQRISVEHALREAAAVTYLIGRGFSPNVAHQIVESWWHS
ncbi:hypothetical protein [Paenibacillus marinisediminis]